MAAVSAGARIPRGTSTLIDIEIVGSTVEVERMLALLDNCFSQSGMQRFLGVHAAEYLRDRAKARFEREGDDAVGRWSPLAPATVKIRESGIRRGEWPGIGPSHPINKRTGDLEEYITQGRGDVVHTSASSALYYPQRGAPTVNKGLRSKVARAQQGGRNTPRRPVLGAAVTDLNRILWRLGEYIERGGV